MTTDDVDSWQAAPDPVRSGVAKGFLAYHGCGWREFRSSKDDAVSSLAVHEGRCPWASPSEEARPVAVPAGDLEMLLDHVNVRDAACDEHVDGCPAALRVRVLIDGSGNR